LEARVTFHVLPAQFVHIAELSIPLQALQISPCKPLEGKIQALYLFCFCHHKLEPHKLGLSLLVRCLCLSALLLEALQLGLQQSSPSAYLLRVIYMSSCLAINLCRLVRTALLMSPIKLARQM